MINDYHKNIATVYNKNIFNFKTKTNGSYHTYKKAKMVKKNDKEKRIKGNDSR